MTSRRKSHNAGRGKCIAWLREHVSYDGEGCLIWPFHPGPYGYGLFGLNGKILYAHRWMCEQIRGPAPTPEHQAAHECNNGHGGCVHPKHLLWKTPLENSRDKIANGTCFSKKGQKRNKLTREQVDEIRQITTIAGQTEAAERFGVSSSMIRKIIYGKAWGPRNRPWKDFADDDIRRIRSLKGSTKVSEVAAEYSVSIGVIYNIWNGRNWAHVA